MIIGTITLVTHTTTQDHTFTYLARWTHTLLPTDITCHSSSPLPFTGPIVTHADLLHTRCYGYLPVVTYREPIVGRCSVPVLTFCIATRDPLITGH